MINLIVNGNSYSYPQPGDKANTGWGSQATNWASAVTAALTALGLGGTLTPTPNAVIDINSTTKGILVPRLTTTQRNAITSPATSLLIFNTTLGVFQYYSDSAWITIGAKIPDNVQFDGTLTVNGNISTNGGITAVGAVTGATGNFTDATDAINSITAPVKTAGGVGIAKKLFVGTDANVGGNANITGKALTGDGTVSAPTYSFVNDPDSGLYRISENKIGFAANGVRQGEFGVGYGGFTGNIIQSVSSQTTTQVSNTSNSNWVDSNLSCSITPKYNNSKIIIILSQSYYMAGANNGAMRILRDSNVIYTNGYACVYNNLTIVPIVYMDTISSIATYVYKTQFKIQTGGSGTFYMNFSDASGSQTSNMVLLEVQV